MPGVERSRRVFVEAAALAQPAIWLALVAPMGEDGNLIGLFVQAFFATVVLGLALLAYVVANRLRSRSRT